MSKSNQVSKRSGNFIDQWLMRSQNVTISNIGQSPNHDAKAADLPVQCDSGKMRHFQST